MKAILNYKGFTKEIRIMEPLPEIFIPVQSKIRITNEPENMLYSPLHYTAEKLRFVRGKVQREGFWIFKELVAYYKFDGIEERTI